MTWWQSILLGLIQGLTEFLPVSSSGHLAIGRELLGVEGSSDLMFEVVVHVATVLATIVVFRKQIWGLLKGFFSFRKCDEMDYVLKILLATVPIFIVGMFFKDQVEALFSSLYVVGGALLLTAVLLYFSDTVSNSSYRKANAHRNGLSYLQALAIGLAQAVAVIPGLSRSGTTISAGLLVGGRRDMVAQFSFLMVIIPVLGEAFLSVAGGELAQCQIDVLPLLLGFITAFISGLLACKAMIALVKKAKLKWFALYCLLVGAAVIIFKSLM